MRVDGVSVRHAKASMDSHITGRFADDREDGFVPFPVVQDPSQIPGFVQHVPSAEEKVQMLERLKSAVLTTEVETATIH